MWKTALENKDPMENVSSFWKQGIYRFMIWHEWEGVNLEPVHNSQLLFSSLRSEKNVFDLFIVFEFQVDRLETFFCFVF